ncbi:MOSC domain-containing protein [Pedobacter sp. SYSU D00535]|uniref:MOSC domain-containing protein n=1 Tax=Pedobacter sp. SYSU D00535 TaxID=2810308 RepID=UPI001A97A4F2|nr:MOSC domain-containing protein [Pedobacter sp. SYSU D00535]
MKVQDIYTYPVKSLGGIKTDSALALEKGFQFDRRWMLVDLDGKFLSQRTEHQLALFQTQITEGGLLVTHKLDFENGVTIPFSTTLQNSLEVSVWDDTVEALALSEEIDDWFSSYLKKPCRLVFFPEGYERAVSPKYADHGENVSFADAFPYLLISQASLDDLNQKLDKPVPMNRFRPNLVVAGVEPFSEDIWKEIQIGEVRFKVAKPCARCVLTTVDQETGIKGREPLATLARYRTVDKKVLFGQNLLALNEGRINAGDPVRIISYKS